MNYCEKCGSAVSDEALFCGRCGSRLSDGVAEMRRPSIDDSDVDQSQYAEMMRYSKPSWFGFVLALIVDIAICAAVYAARGLTVGLVLFAVVASCFVLFRMVKLIDYGGQLKLNVSRLEQSNKLAAACADFSNAVSFGDDAVRFGESFCFGKASHSIIAYDDVASIYLQVTKTTRGEITDRDLMAVMSNGNKERIASLGAGADADSRVNTIVALFLAKNPHITIGNK